MNFSKSNLAKVIMTFVALIAFMHLKTYEVKADAVINSQQGVVVRSANYSTEKVVKVPEKKATTVNTASATSKTGSSSTALSRGTSTPVSGSANNVVNYAYKYLGSPYVWGASGPKAFDCSGFTMYVYSAFGVSLPHYTGSQFQVGQAVSRSNLAAGDLVFFNTYGSISHVGIYIGGGSFIHASSSTTGVIVSNLSEGYYNSNYAGARRVLK